MDFWWPEITHMGISGNQDCISGGQKWISSGQKLPRRAFLGTRNACLAARNGFLVAIHYSEANFWPPEIQNLFRMPPWAET